MYGPNLEASGGGAVFRLESETDIPQRAEVV